MFTCYSLERLNRECLYMYYVTLKEQTCNWKQWLSLRRVSGLLFFTLNPFVLLNAVLGKKKKKKTKGIKNVISNTQGKLQDVLVVINILFLASPHPLPIFSSHSDELRLNKIILSKNSTASDLLKASTGIRRVFFSALPRFQNLIQISRFPLELG